MAFARGTLTLARTIKTRLAPALVARRAFATPVVVGQVRHAIFHKTGQPQGNPMTNQPPYT
jgi:hypothetical protein